MISTFDFYICSFVKALSTSQTSPNPALLPTSTSLTPSLHCGHHGSLPTSLQVLRCLVHRPHSSQRALLTTNSSQTLVNLKLHTRTPRASCLALPSPPLAQRTASSLAFSCFSDSIVTTAVSPRPSHWWTLCLARGPQCLHGWHLHTHPIPAPVQSGDLA